MAIPTTKRVDLFYGLLIAGGLIVLFLIMKFAGLVHVVELRVLNLIIMAVGVNQVLKRFTLTDLNQQFNYIGAFFLGVTTAIFASLIFALFLFIYVSFIDQELMQSIIEHEPMGRFLNPYVASFVVAIEGVLSGILVTFMIINVRNASNIENTERKK